MVAVRCRDRAKLTRAIWPGNHVGIMLNGDPRHYESMARVDELMNDGYVS